MIWPCPETEILRIAQDKNRIPVLSQKWDTANSGKTHKGEVTMSFRLMQQLEHVWKEPHPLPLLWLTPSSLLREYPPHFLSRNRFHREAPILCPLRRGTGQREGVQSYPFTNVSLGQSDFPLKASNKPRSYIQLRGKHLIFLWTWLSRKKKSNSLEVSLQTWGTRWLSKPSWDHFVFTEREIQTSRPKTRAKRE